MEHHASYFVQAVGAAAYHPDNIEFWVYSHIINTDASPNQNGLNPNATVGSLAIADLGYGGPWL